MNQLEDWGWDAEFQDRFQSLGRVGVVPARVIEEQRDGYTVVAQRRTCRAQVTGRMRHEAWNREALPAVGDWVALDAESNDQGLIHAVVPRRTALLRKQAGAAVAAQVVAANLNVVFLMTSLNADLEPRRIERYLAVIWESGAQPVLLLSKADLTLDPDAASHALEGIALGAPIHTLSALHGVGVEAVLPYLTPGRTVALVGSSGVGKSTLLNRLVGEDVQTVRTIRSSDERGCHTTTARRMVRLPTGALLVDTPGMRELGLWSAEDGLEEAFADVGALAETCRFRDCTHGEEPGCAVQASVADGQLEAERVKAWGKLRREMERLARKQDTRAALEHSRKLRQRHKEQARNTRARKRARGER